MILFEVSLKVSGIYHIYSILALQAGTWKADEIGANTEPSALACRSSNTGAHHIQNGENSRGHYTQGEDLIPRESVTRNKDRSHCHKQTLHQIFDHAIQYLGCGVHNFYISHRDFFRVPAFFPSKAKPLAYYRMSSPAHEDFLEEDVEIPGQRFCLLSFLSPEKVLANKDVFLFNQFIKTYEFQSRTKNLEAYLMNLVTGINAKLDKEADSLLEQDLSGASEICRKSKIRLDTLMDDYHNFVKTNEHELKESKLKELYDDFLFANRTKMEDEFYAQNDFRTTVRGLKIRGVYGTQGEAVARSKKLQRQDTLHNIFVGEVGKWLPWDPEPSEIGEQEYAEEQLNTLMKKYKENEEQREQFQKEQRGRHTSKRSEEAGVKMISDETSSPESFSDMFSSVGPADLAMARKTVKDLSGNSA